MKKMGKWFKYFMGAVAVLVLACIILMLWPAASQWVSSMTGVAVDKIKSIAQTVVGAGLGVLMVGWGIAAISVPILGGAMILIGLALIVYSVWPLFKSSSTGTGLQKIQ